MAKLRILKAISAICARWSTKEVFEYRIAIKISSFKYQNDKKIPIKNRICCLEAFRGNKFEISVFLLGPII